jgi:demethylmenaquinone methyltransferase/2-methoxy-6-polyprenyl-1,4-benzoquinol methylase
MLDIRSSDYLDDPERKRFFNRRLFAEVAPKYDFVTRALSFGRDQAWKRKLIASCPSHPENPRCVDLACGTGDICRSLAARFPEADITGIDLSEDMLAIARRNTPDGDWRCEDMGTTSIKDASVDIITGGYALRNAPQLDVALKEIERMLKPGGHAAFLDFSKSPNRPMAALTHGLLKFWGSFWGIVLHRNPDVYGYIAGSLARFPDRNSLNDQVTEAGLTVDSSQLFYGGMLQLLVIHKPG